MRGVSAFKIIVAAIVAVTASGNCPAADKYTVKTRNGLVRGFDEEGTMAFKGIPYAKAGRYLCFCPRCGRFRSCFLYRE